MESLASPSCRPDMANGAVCCRPMVDHKTHLRLSSGLGKEYLAEKQTFCHRLASKPTCACLKTTGKFKVHSICICIKHCFYIRGRACGTADLSDYVVHMQPRRKSRYTPHSTQKHFRALHVKMKMFTRGLEASALRVGLILCRYKDEPKEIWIQRKINTAHYATIALPEPCQTQAGNDAPVPQTPCHAVIQKVLAFNQQ